MIAAPTPEAFQTAVGLLASGDVVAFPTETVYGLGASVVDDAAVQRVFEIKGRPPDHPLLVHVHGREGIDRFAASMPAWVDRLVSAFWPGPLSIVLPRRPGVASVASGGLPTVGIRCPSHPVARELLRACAQLPQPILGLAAPSANRFGRVSPTQAGHVEAEFGRGMFVLDGGPCSVGIESTIVDCTRDLPVVLRPGLLTHEEIERVTGIRTLAKDEAAAPGPRVSGSLEAHYAPRARVVLYERQALQSHLSAATQPGMLAVWARDGLVLPAGLAAHAPMPEQAEEAARQLFAVLRRFDDLNVREIAVEAPPSGYAWEGVRDRLRRAAAATKAG